MNPAGLTDSEVDVVRGVADGMTLKEVAARLSRGVKGVECAYARAKGKLGVTNYFGHVEVARKAFELGIAELKQRKMSALNPNIEAAFTYHAPKPGQPEKYTELRNKAKELAYLIDALCPASREKALAQTKLEEGAMWANAAIARNE